MDDNPIKVLLVDDDENDYILIRNLLAKVERMRFELEWVGTYEDALELIRRQEHDVYLLDYRLDGRTELDLLREAVAHGCTAPMIVLTGQGDHEVDVEAMRVGAQDFLVKGQIEAPLLERSIRYAIERSRLARYDSLTNLPNRSLLQDRLRQSIVQADRSNKLVAVLFIDLDGFKRINDTLGHDCGDLMLKTVAQRITGQLRDSDTAGRMGGDEFIAVLTNLARGPDASKVARKTSDALSKPMTLEGHNVSITASIGISLYPCDAKDADTLIKYADAAMYRAKEKESNSYVFCSPDMNTRALERLAMETMLRHGLKREELLLHYQPRFDLNTRAVIGVEALLRWQHPDLGLLLPADFLPIAEDSGLIIPIGEWVLREACLQQRTWQAEGLPPLLVAVNLSHRQLKNKGLLDTVKKMLEEFGLAPNDLELELSENSIMQNADAALATLQELHATGIGIAMDDFGTGYSSLSYLKRFPIRTLKIDHTVVHGINTDPDSEAIIKAIIAMGRTFNLTVVAEGVETAEQLAFLHAHGCDQAQGNYLCRPVPGNAMAEELIHLLAAEAAGLPLAQKGSAPL